MSFFNSEILPPLDGWSRPILGRDPYNKKNVDDSSKATLKAVSVVSSTFRRSYFLSIPGDSLRPSALLDKLVECLRLHGTFKSIVLWDVQLTPNA